MPPRRWLWWAIGLAVVPCLSLSVVTGLVLRVDAWSQGGVLEGELVDFCLALHRALFDAGVALLFVLLIAPRLGAREVPPSWPRVALALVGISLAVSLAVLGPLAFGGLSDTAWRAASPVPLIVGIACLFVSAASARWDAPTIAGIGFALATLLTGVLAVLPASEGVVVLTPAIPSSMPWLAVVALATAVDPLVEDEPRWRAGLALGLLLLWLMPLAAWLNVPEEIPLFTRASAVGALFVLVAAARGLRTSPAPLGARIAALLAVLLIAPTWLLERGITVNDLMLDDTLAPVGVLHLRLVGIGCAVLATLERPWSHRASVAALVLYVAGGLTLGGSLIALGFLGMPQRYHTYLPNFEPLQRLATGGALGLVVGMLLLAVIAARSPAREGA
jgi:hypothetical protein